MGPPGSPTRGGALTLGTATRLREQILDGRWPYLSRLPPDAEFARQLGVGTNTVRRAMAVLADEGLVERRRGSGTVVVGRAAGQTRAAPTVGLAVSADMHYFRPLIAGVQDSMQSADGRVLVRTSTSKANSEQMVADLALLLESGVDGLVLVPPKVSMTDHAFIGRLEELEVPVVLAERTPYTALDEESPHSRLSSVVSDIRRGGLVAVHHLVETGHTRIGLLSSRDTVTSEEFYRGFLRASHDLVLTVRPETIMRWHFGRERPQRRERTVRRYVNMLIETCVDAVVCFDNLLAVHLLRQLATVGLNVPDDISIVVYDDAGPKPTIPLTAVIPSRYEVGRLAGHTLLRQIELGTTVPTTHIVVAPQLVTGASTAPRERPSSGDRRNVS